MRQAEAGRRKPERVVCPGGLATEIDRGQARGEIATGGRPLKPSEDGTVSETTIDDLGVSRQRLCEWRETRDAGEDVTRDLIAEWAKAALDEESTPEAERQARGSDRRVIDLVNWKRVANRDRRRVGRQ